MGFSVLRIWFFGFRTLKLRFFSFRGLPRFAGFLEFSLWFSVFVNNDDGFSDFIVQCILRFFLVLPRKLHLTVALKPVIPSDHANSVLTFLSKKWMTSLVCLAAIIWVVTEKLKITSKQRTISLSSCGCDLRLNHGFVRAQCLFVAGKTLRSLAPFMHVE